MRSSLSATVIDILPGHQMNLALTAGMSPGIKFLPELDDRVTGTSKYPKTSLADNSQESPS
jgi:hypothetical protein